MKQNNHSIHNISKILHSKSYLKNFHIHSFYGENNTATLSITIFKSNFEVEELEQRNTLFSTNNLISTSIKVGLYYSHSKNQRGKIRYLKSE